jgi:hypothetical protein
LYDDLKRYILAGLIIPVGTNTFPNFVPVSNGYSAEDLARICYPTRYTKFDECPFIWKRFDEANYLTGLVEDTPSGTMFNYYKTGFVKQPVDFYSRPLWFAAIKYAGVSLSLHISLNKMLSENVIPDLFYCNLFSE